MYVYNGSVGRFIGHCCCVLGNNSLQSKISLDTIEGDDLLATT